LGEAFDVRDGTHDTPKYTNTGVPLVTSKHLNAGKIDFSNVKFISEEDHLAISKRSNVQVNDILFAMIGSIGNPALVQENKTFSIKNVALFKGHNKTSSPFLLLFLKATEHAMKVKSAGGLQPFVSLTFLRNHPFPLPPLAEQKRIVAKVDACFANLDALAEQLKTQRQHIQHSKKALLQRAVSGRLVPQHAEEGTGHDLLKQIQAEKQKQTKATTKKGKSL
jgi:type I restriction enzyme S subunit